MINIYAEEYFNENIISKSEYILAGNNENNNKEEEQFEYKIPTESEEM